MHRIVYLIETNNKNGQAKSRQKRAIVATECVQVAKIMAGKATTTEVCLERNRKKKHPELETILRQEHNKRNTHIKRIMRNACTELKAHDLYMAKDIWAQR